MYHDPSLAHSGTEYICISTKKGEPREKGRHAGVEAKLVQILWRHEVVVSNQVKFGEDLYPYRNRSVVGKNVDENANIGSLDQRGIIWMKYSNKIDLNGFEEIRSGGSSDSYILVLRSISKPKVHVGEKREEFFQSLLKKRSDELPRRATRYQKVYELSVQVILSQRISPVYINRMQF